LPHKIGRSDDDDRDDNDDREMMVMEIEGRQNGFAEEFDKAEK
jgi:hypothetical protein